MRRKVGRHIISQVSTSNVLVLASMIDPPNELVDRENSSGTYMASIKDGAYSHYVLFRL